MDYYVWDPIIGTLSKTRAKAGQHHAELKVRFVANTE